MKRDSFIVYKSFYGLIKLLPDKEKVKMFEAIFDFGFDETIPTFKDETSKAIWQSIYPQLNANNRRYKNGIKGKEFGKLGGRPKNTDGDKNKTPKKTPNPLENKTPNITPNENDNDNVYISQTRMRALEDEKFTAFMQNQPQIVFENENFEIGEIDFGLLEKNINESEFLKGISSFRWIVEHYEKIKTGYYKTVKKKSVKAFENQRNYSKEELNDLVDDLEDL